MEIMSWSDVAWCVCEEVQNRGARYLPAAAAVAVAGVVYLVWGKVWLAASALAVIALAFQLTGRAKEITAFDVSTFGLLAAALGMPFLGGPLAYVGSAYMASSLIVHQWAQYKIFINLREENQKINENNQNLVKCSQNIGNQEQVLIGHLERLNLANTYIDGIENGNRQIRQEGEDFQAKMRTLEEGLKRLNGVFSCIKQGEAAAQQVIALAQILTQIQQELRGSLSGLHAQKDQLAELKTKYENLFNVITARLAQP